MEASAGESMSTIGSEYASQRRSVDELEKEYEQQRKKAAEREKMREAKLEKNLEHTVKRKDAEAENSVRTVKDRYESALADQSKSDKVEREAIRRSLYDRSGRSARALSDDAKQERDRALENAAVTEASYKKAASGTESYYQERSKEQAAEKERDMEALADTYRKQIAELRGAESDSDELKDYRAKLKEESQAAIRQAREEVMIERRQAKIMAEQNEIVLKDRSKKADHLLNTRLNEKDLSTKAELNANAEAARASRNLELQPLREQVMETAEMKRKSQGQWNNARVDAIRELESDWNMKYTNQTLSHDLEKQKLRQNNSETERNFGNKLGGIIKERDSEVSKMISEQNLEHRSELSNSAKEYNRSLDHLKLQADRDKRLAGELLNREREQASERQSRNLEKQSATYQTTIANQRQNQQAQIENLERVLNNKNTTDNPGEISAAAEQAVRGAVTRQYDKVFQAEADRDARARDHLHESYQAKLSDTVQDKHTTTAALNRRNLSEQALMRDTFIQHVADVEDNKRQMLDLANASNQKMADSTLRGNERGLNEVRRHYEDLIASRDMENGTRLQDVKTQSEFEKRSMRREFSSQTADMIRSYEKKINDQKVVSEDQLRDMKAKLDSEMRERDRFLKQAMADQARSYEHRIAAHEAQSKDREKVLARNQEEEIDKVKKANALLLSKKG